MTKGKKRLMFAIVIFRELRNRQAAKNAKQESTDFTDGTDRTETTS